MDLMNAAARGGLTTQQYEEVATLLQEKADDAEHVVSTLYIVQCALLHPPDNPLQPPPALVASRLLPMLTSLLDRCAKTDPSFVDCLAVADAVCAVVYVLLRPAVNNYFQGLEHGLATREAAFAHWAPLISLLLGGKSVEQAAYLSWLSAAARCLLTENDAPVLHTSSEFSKVTGSRDLPKLPGTAAMLAIGSLSILQLALDADTPFPAPKLLLPTSSPVDDREDAAVKLALVLCEDPHLPMPDGALSSVMFTLLLEGRGALSDVLLRMPKAVRALAGPLQALGEDPTCWQQAPYSYHVQVLGYLCQWTASRHGLEGVQKLVPMLASSTINALSALLYLREAGQRAGAACLVRNCLVLLTHLASTSEGRNMVANAKCSERWLQVAPLWQEQPAVVRHIVLLVRVPLVDYNLEPYFSPLFSDKAGWCFDLVVVQPGSCSVWPAPSQPQEVNCIAMLLEANFNSSTQALLIDVLARICESAVYNCQPATKALLAAAKFSASGLAAAYRRLSGEGDVGLYMVALGLVGEMSMQQALAVAIDCIRKDGRRRYAHWTVHSFHRVVDATLPAKLQSLCMEWLVHYADDTPRDSIDPAARLAFWCNLEAMLEHGLLPAEFMLQNRMLERCLRILERMCCSEECNVALRVAHVMYMLSRQSLKESPDDARSYEIRMSLLLSAPATLSAILTFISGRLSSSNVAEALWSVAGLPDHGLGQEESDEAHRVLRPLLLLLHAASYWPKHADHYVDALYTLLTSDVWAVIKRLISRRRSLDDVILNCLQAAVNFLQAVMSMHRHEELQSLADDAHTSLMQRYKARNLSPLSLSDDDSDNDLGMLDDIADDGDDDVLGPFGVEEAVLWESGAAAAEVSALLEALAAARAGGSAGASGSGSAGASGNGSAAAAAAAAAAAGGGGGCDKGEGSGDDNGGGGGGDSSECRATCRSPAQPDVRVDSDAAAASPKRGMVCSACHKPGEKLLSCSRCHGAVRYCSKACQQSDWKQHRQRCNELRRPS